MRQDTIVGLVGIPFRPILATTLAIVRGRAGHLDTFLRWSLAVAAAFTRAVIGAAVARLCHRPDGRRDRTGPQLQPHRGRSEQGVVAPMRLASPRPQTSRTAQESPMAAAPLLHVRNLSTTFHTPTGPVRAVDDISF